MIHARHAWSSAEAPPTFTVPPGFNIGGSAPTGYCRVLRFVHGKISEVQYAGATDILDARDAACGQIVRTCLDYPKPGKEARAR